VRAELEDNGKTVSHHFRGDWDRISTQWGGGGGGDSDSSTCVVGGVTFLFF
jgi:hypothetical protein